MWDHRSSRPLALFHTSPVVDPSFSTDLSSSRAISPSRSPNQPTIVLYDPVTGESSTGTSTSGREAARVVKFSPEGSSRDLMVFTEVCLSTNNWLTLGKLQLAHCRCENLYHPCRRPRPIRQQCGKPRQRANRRRSNRHRRCRIRSVRQLALFGHATDDCRVGSEKDRWRRRRDMDHGLILAVITGIYSACKDRIINIVYSIYE